MEKRKNPEKDLRKQSGLFFHIGLLAAMMLAVSAFEFRTVEVIDPIDIATGNIIDDPIIPITTHDVPPPPPKPKPVLANPVEAEPDEVVVDTEVTFDITELPDPEEIIIEEPPVEKADDGPWEIVEEMPTPIGGLEALYKFINQNLKYPAQARRMGIEGTVFLSFVVDEKGNMVDIQIAKGIGAGCDEEVLRIFKNPPKWNPGKQRFVPVKVKQMIPVKFVLN